MRSLYLHLGFPKTATTFQQLEIFPKLKEVEYHPILTKKEYEKVVQLIISKDLTDKECIELRGRLTLGLKKDKFLLSQEIFSTGLFGFFSMGEEQRRCAIYNFRKIFTDFHIRILVSIRQQTEIIKSYYMLYLHKGGTKEIFGFLNQSSGANHVDIDKPFYNLFKYSNFLDLCAEIFTRNNLFIYVFEKLFTDPVEYLNRMINFLMENDCPKVDFKVHNKGYNRIQVKLSRVLNRGFRTEQNPNGLIPRIIIPGIGEISPRRFLQSRWFPHFSSNQYTFPEYLHSQIREAYREDNLYINEKYSLDLPESYY